MPDTFSYEVSKGTSAQVTYNLATAKFGDGYSQTVKDGLNAKVHKWTVQIQNMSATRFTDVQTFLDGHIGQSFYWTPPGGVQALFMCTDFTQTPSDCDYQSISATFQEVFQP